MNYLKKLWNAEYLVIKVNRKFIGVGLAFGLLYGAYSWGYVRGVNMVINYLASASGDSTSTTSSK